MSIKDLMSEYLISKDLQMDKLRNCLTDDVKKKDDVNKLFEDEITNELEGDFELVITNDYNIKEKIECHYDLKKAEYLNRYNNNMSLNTLSFEGSDINSKVDELFIGYPKDKQIMSGFLDSIFSRYHPKLEEIYCSKGKRGQERVYAAIDYAVGFQEGVKENLKKDLDAIEREQCGHFSDFIQDFLNETKTYRKVFSIFIKHVDILKNITVSQIDVNVSQPLQKLTQINQAFRATHPGIEGYFDREKQEKILWYLIDFHKGLAKSVPFSVGKNFSQVFGYEHRVVSHMAQAIFKEKSFCKRLMVNISDKISKSAKYLFGLPALWFVMQETFQYFATRDEKIDAQYEFAQNVIYKSGVCIAIGSLCYIQYFLISKRVRLLYETYQNKQKLIPNKWLN